MTARSAMRNARRLRHRSTSCLNRHTPRIGPLIAHSFEIGVIVVSPDRTFRTKSDQIHNAPLGRNVGRWHMFRWAFSRRRQGACETDVLCEDKVWLSRCTLLGPVRVGYRSYANETLLRNVDIGRFCSIGRRCSIGGALHDVDCFTTHPSAASRDFVRDPQTRIGNDVWIGDNVLILSGITVEDGAIIGGGAVVTKDVPAYTIVAGSPARALRERFDPATVAALRRSKWWTFGDAARQIAGLGASPEQLVHELERCQPRLLEPHFRRWRPA